MKPKKLWQVTSVLSSHKTNSDVQIKKRKKVDVNSEKAKTYVSHQNALLSYPKMCFAGLEAPFASASDERIVIEVLIYWLNL